MDELNELRRLVYNFASLDYKSANFTDYKYYVDQGRELLQKHHGEIDFDDPDFDPYFVC